MFLVFTNRHRCIKQPILTGLNDMQWIRWPRDRMYGSFFHQHPLQNNFCSLMQLVSSEALHYFRCNVAFLQQLERSAVNLQKSQYIFISKNYISAIKNSLPLPPPPHFNLIFPVVQLQAKYTILSRLQYWTEWQLTSWHHFHRQR